MISGGLGLEISTAAEFGGFLWFLEGLGLGISDVWGAWVYGAFRVWAAGVWREVGRVEVWWVAEDSGEAVLANVAEIIALRMGLRHKALKP